MKNLHQRIPISSKMKVVSASVVIVIAGLFLTLAALGTATSGTKMAVSPMPNPTPLIKATNPTPPGAPGNAVSPCQLWETEQEDPPSSLETPSSLLCKKWTFTLILNISSEFANNQNVYLNLKEFKNNCYVDTNNNFVCYWKDPKSACAARVADLNKNTNNMYKDPKVTKLPDVDDYYNCSYTDAQSQMVTGPFKITLEKANPELHCADAVSGRFRNFPDYSECGNTGRPGGRFTTAQRNTILKADSVNNQGNILSDAFGYQYPKPATQACIGKPLPGNMCVEPQYLTGKYPAEDSPEIDHIVPKRDRFGCRCGTNSMKNAAVISRQLNRVLSNDPTTAMLHSWAKNSPSYPVP